MTVAIAWVRMPIGFAELLPQKRLRGLLRNPLAAEYVRRLWEHCSSEQISGVIPKGDVELAAGWEGEPGALVAAALEAGVLREEGDGYEVCRWRDENKAAIDKANRDRVRLQEAREAERAARGAQRAAGTDRQSVDNAPEPIGTQGTAPTEPARGAVIEGVARPSRVRRASVAGTDGRTDGRTDGHTHTAVDATAPPESAVCVDFQNQNAGASAPVRQGSLALSGAPEPEPRPSLRLVTEEEALNIEVERAWVAYQRLEPDAELTPNRRRLMMIAVRQHGLDVRLSFEGRAGAPSTKRELLPTLPGLLEDERISKGVALRRMPGWKDPTAARSKSEQPAPSAPAMSAAHVSEILASLPDRPWRK